MFKLSYKQFKKVYSPPVDHLLDRPSIDLRTRITGIRPGELDTMVSFVFKSYDELNYKKMKVNI